MKKKIIILSIAAFVALSVGALFAYLNPASHSLLFGEDVEALSSCEIKDRDGDVVFSCDGDNQKCEITRYGHTLTCSGRKQPR